VALPVSLRTKTMPTLPRATSRPWAFSVAAKAQGIESVGLEETGARFGRQDDKRRVVQMARTP
jgi:hypothetical protein